MFVWFRYHPSLLANALSSICDIIFGIVRIVISSPMYWLRTSSTRLNTRKIPDSTKQTVPAAEGVALSFMPSFSTFKTPRQKSLHLVRFATNSYFQSSGAQVVCFTSRLKSGRALWWMFMVMAWTAPFTRVNVESTVVLGLYQMDTLCT